MGRQEPDPHRLGGHNDQLGFYSTRSRKPLSQIEQEGNMK